MTNDRTTICMALAENSCLDPDATHSRIFFEKTSPVGQIPTGLFLP
jgi:hypothetical protein